MSVSHIQEDDLQQKVEVIVQRYLTSLNIKYNDPTDKNFDLIDKQFQKNQLLDKIIDSFKYLLDAQTQLIKEEFNTKLDNLDQDLNQVKALVLRGGYQTAPNFDSKINSAPELEVSITDSFLGEDRPQKDLLKFVTDLDEKTRQKLKATQNHINILMDLQLQMKAQVSLLMEKQEPKPHDIALVNQLIPHVLEEIDVFLELKMDFINKNTQDLITKEKLQYWTVINDLSEKIETFMYLLNKQVGSIRINQEIVHLEKQTQKNLLLDQVINQFSSIIESHQDQMQKKLNLQLKTLESEISSIKEMVKKSWQDIGRTSSHSRNMSMIEMDISQDSILVEDRNSIKDIIRKIKDLDENTRRKCQSTENHVNILMDLQIQLKAQLSSFMIQKSNEEVDHEKIEIKIMPNIIREIDSIVDQRLNTVQKIIQEGQNKDKDKYKFYVTIINDLTEKFESLKKDFDTTLVQKQEQKKQGVMSLFRRTPFLPF